MDDHDVERIINMSSPEPPEHRFIIDIPSQKRSANRAVLFSSAAALLLDIAVYSANLRFTGSGDTDDRIKIAVGAVLLVLMALAVLSDLLTENIARVTGEELKINEKSYFACDIERIACKNYDVKVISGGKPVLKLTKMHEGCGELMKWARAYDIPIENDTEPPSVKFRIFAFLSISAIFAAFILIMLYFIKS